MSTKITKEIVGDIAQLARINIATEETERIADSFGPVMEMIDQVNEVDLGENVQRNFRVKNVMRDDVLRDDSSENRDEIVGSFPKAQNDYLRTKKILG